MAKTPTQTQSQSDEVAEPTAEAVATEAVAAVAEVEPTAVDAAAAAIYDWGDENGHPNHDLAELRNYAPHDLIEVYDAAVAAQEPEAPEAA